MWITQVSITKRINNTCSGTLRLYIEFWILFSTTLPYILDKYICLEFIHKILDTDVNMNSIHHGFSDCISAIYQTDLNTWQYQFLSRFYSLLKVLCKMITAFTPAYITMPVHLSTLPKMFYTDHNISCISYLFSSDRAHLEHKVSCLAHALMMPINTWSMGVWILCCSLITS